jgi:hypothetical protein
MRASWVRWPKVAVAQSGVCTPCVLRSSSSFLKCGLRRNALSGTYRDVRAGSRARAARGVVVLRRVLKFAVPKYTLPFLHAFCFCNFLHILLYVLRSTQFQVWLAIP